LLAGSLCPLISFFRLRPGANFFFSFSARHFPADTLTVWSRPFRHLRSPPQPRKDHLQQAGFPPCVFFRYYAGLAFIDYLSPSFTRWCWRSLPSHQQESRVPICRFPKAAEVCVPLCGLSQVLAEHSLSHGADTPFEGAGVFGRHAFPSPPLGTPVFFFFFTRVARAFPEKTGFPPEHALPLFSFSRRRPCSSRRRFLDVFFSFFLSRDGLFFLLQNTPLKCTSGFPLLRRVSIAPSDPVRPTLSQSGTHFSESSFSITRNIPFVHCPFFSPPQVRRVDADSPPAHFSERHSAAPYHFSFSLNTTPPRVRRPWTVAFPTPPPPPNLRQ